MKRISPLLKESTDLFNMPLTNSINIGKYPSVDTMVKQSAHSFVTSIIQGASRSTPTEFGITSSAYNNIDLSTSVGSDAANYNIKLRSMSSELAEQVSPVIKERVLNAFNEEKKAQQDIKLDEETIFNMALSEDFSALEVTAFQKKVADKKLKRRESLFESLFKLNAVVHEHTNPTNEQLVQETVFNLACMEVFNELGMLKEGVDTTLVLKKIRTELIQSNK